MTKNITVADENGKVIGSTYPKRALGLVKKDKARWINANTICLRAQDMEEKTMANNLYEVIDNQMSKIQQQLVERNPDTEEYVAVNTIIMETLTNLQENERKNSVVNLVKEQLTFFNNDMKNTSGVLTTEYGDAAFASREETKQKMLALMEQLIHDTMSPNTPIPPKFNKTSADAADAQPNNSETAEKLSQEFSDKLNGEINSAFNDTNN